LTLNQTIGFNSPLIKSFRRYVIERLLIPDNNESGHIKVESLHMFTT